MMLEVLKHEEANQIATQINQMQGRLWEVSKIFVAALAEANREAGNQPVYVKVDTTRSEAVFMINTDTSNNQAQNRVIRI